jgi:hypothetical protein
MRRIAWTLAVASIVLVPVYAARAQPADPPLLPQRLPPLVAAQAAQAPVDVSARLDALARRVDELQARVSRGTTNGGVLFLFGVFCALWAQNTRRSAWGWFFLGLFFSVITVLVLLWKNAGDLDRAQEAQPGTPGA